MALIPTISGGSQASIDKIAKEQELRHNYTGLFAQYKNGVKDSKRKYINSLTSLASKFNSNKERFNKFEQAIVKYGMLADRGDLSFDTFVVEYKKNKQLAMQGKVLPHLKSGLENDGTGAFQKRYFGAQTPKQLRNLYIMYLVDYVNEMHYRDLEAAQENYNKYNAGNVPHIKMDITKPKIEDGKLSDTGLGLDEFIDQLKSEGTLARRAKPEYFKSTIKNSKQARDDAKKSNWMDSWWHNLQYSLVELGWEDIRDVLDELVDDYGIQVDKIYSDIFKNSSYDFVYEYNTPTGEHSAEHENLRKDLLGLVKNKKKNKKKTEG